MADVISLEIATDMCEFPYEKRFPSSLKLGEFKSKLELIVGAEAKTIGINLLDSEGKLVAKLTGDDATLKELGVKSGMRICAVDLSGGNKDLNDDSMIEKYEMSDAAYEQRTDSVRAWKKKILGEKAEGADQVEDPYAEAAKTIKVGDRCEVTVGMARRGCVAYVGATQFKPGTWIGVRYDEPVGKNDGSVGGVRYFECDAKYGGFVRPTDLKCGDFPEEEIDEL